MDIQVLVATVNNRDINNLVGKMNIQTKSIVCNQCDRYSYEELNYKGNTIQCFNFKEKGVGLNRNNALMRANADILLIADDDIEYIDNYKEIVIGEFENKPEADMIIFNMESSNNERPRYTIKKRKRVKKYNCLRYGAVRMAIKLDAVKKNNLYFSLLFGGGAKYSSGEDSLFIYECINKKLNVYTSPKFIGRINDYGSSWFKGYDDKFFIDKGALFKCLSPRFPHIMGIQYVIRKRKLFNKYKSTHEAIKLIFDGIKKFDEVY